MNYFITSGGGLTPLAWTLLGLIPPAILALYFLKLKRKPVEVPSTFLWRRTIEDLQVNSLWQRLRSSVLLWLQIIAALLLLSACLRPGCDGERTIGASYIIGIDNSASSQTTDVKNGSRLTESVAQATQFIESMKPNDQAMIITISDKAKIRQSYTSNKSLLKEKLINIRPTNHSTDVEELFKLASGIATPSEVEDKGNVLSPEEIKELDEAKKATLKFFSDGRFSKVEDLNLGHLAVEFFSIGQEDTTNVGIVSFNAKPMQSKKRTVEIFYRIENFSESDAKIEVELFRDGELIDASRMEIAADSYQSEGFEDDLSNIDKKIFHYQLKISSDDKFKLDNQADCVVNPSPNPKILLLTEGDGQLQKALSTGVLEEKIELQVEGSEFLETEEYQEACKNTVYNLVIFDRVTPTKMPLSNTMFWGTIPSSGWKATEMESPIFILDSDQSHPLFLGINTSGLLFAQCNKLEGPPRAKTLWESETGPMAVLARREGFQDLVFGFPLSVVQDDELFPNTDWPTRLSFPIFVYQSLENLAGLGSVRISSTSAPGKPFRFNLPVTEPHATIEFPDGSKTQIKPRANGRYEFYQTSQVGLYKIYDSKDEHKLSMAVALNDREESKVGTEEKFDVGFEEVTALEGRKVGAKSHWWKIILGSAFVVLLVEWYFFHRRSIM